MKYEIFEKHLNNVFWYTSLYICYSPLFHKEGQMISRSSLFPWVINFADGIYLYFVGNRYRFAVLTVFQANPLNYQFIEMLLFVLSILGH